MKMPHFWCISVHQSPMVQGRRVGIPTNTYKFCVFEFHHFM